MISNQENVLILKFLKNNYPVFRVKYNGRFKRAIKIDNKEIYYLSDKDAINRLYSILLITIKRVFYINDKKCEEVLKLFLNIQK